MKRFFNLSTFLLATLLFLTSCQEKERLVLISTPMGDMKAKLYNETPRHRDNFLKLAEQGFFNGTLFHRVIPEFMISGR